MGTAVLDFHFFNHLVDIGLMYNFYMHTSLKELDGQKDYPSYQATLGKYFYEEFLVTRLMKKIFRHRHDEILTDRDDPRNPDLLLIQDKKDFFVMEVKSNRLHVNVLEESNATGLEDFLKQNFANEKEAGAKKNKGVFQLIRQLETLANSRKTRNVSVYPIIVYTEPVMDISGVNFYLQSLMKDRLAPLKENFKRILPLTCINVDFFIRFYNELKGDRFFLKNAIIKFHKRMESNRKSYKKSQKPLTYFNSNFSFMRMCEEDAPLDDVMKYFNAAAQDLGFGEAATLH